MTVYLLLHEWESQDGCEHIKVIGVYATEALAAAAVEELRRQPGFREHHDGFTIDPYPLNETNWREGFGFEF